MQTYKENPHILNIIEIVENKETKQKKKHLPGFVSNGPIAAPAKPNPNCPHNLCFPYSFLSCNSFKTAESSNGRTGAFKAAVTVTNTTRA